MRAILAGFMIGIGDVALMSCKNKYVGALLFSVALLSIIKLQLPLYTGRIGKVISERSYIKCLRILICNMIGCFYALFAYCITSRHATELVAKVAGQKAQTGFLSLFVAGFMCNVLIHIAVTAKQELITVLCVMTFILCGFRHSIADAGYAIIGAFVGLSLIPWLFVLIGNTAGGILCETMLSKIKED